MKEDAKKHLPFLTKSKEKEAVLQQPLFVIGNYFTFKV